MDPDANLKEQLFLAKEIQKANDLAEQAWRGEECNCLELNADDLYDFVNKADRLTELVLALNEWIQKGGALPKKWAK